jgi:hypothetical protein
MRNLKSGSFEIVLVGVETCSVNFARYGDLLTLDLLVQSLHSTLLRIDIPLEAKQKSLHPHLQKSTDVILKVI